MDEQIAVLEFLERAGVDARSGSLRDLADYLSRCPAEHHAAVAAEYATLSLACAAPELQSRRRLGRYELLREVGRGGFGRVFEAHDPELDRRVAIKVLDEVRALADDSRERFRREAQAAAGLDHPALCSVLDSGFEGDEPYLVMPFVPGISLDRVIAERRRGSQGPSPIRLPGLEVEDSGPKLRAIFELVAELARGLQAAHDAGVVHRDVKPGNVLVAADGRPVLVDFGLAWVDRGEPTLTRSGPLGTLAYAPPEVLAGRARGAAPALDVWGLGMLLAELVTGERPFNGPTPHAVDQAIRNAPAPSVPVGVEKAFPGLKRVLHTALRKEPRARYATPAALAEDLDRLLHGEPVAARSQGLQARLVGAVRAKPRAALGIAALSLASVATALVVVTLEAAASRERAAALVASMLADAARDAVRRDAADLDTTKTRERLDAVSGWISRIDELVGNEATDLPELRRALADALEAQTDLHLVLGEPRKGAVSSERALQIRSELLEQSTDAESRAEFAVAVVKFGDALSRFDRRRGLVEYRRALRLDQELWAEEPTVARRASAVGHGFVRVSHALHLSGDARDRERLLLRAIEAFDVAERLEPAASIRIGESIDARVYVAQERRARGDLVGACEWVGDAVQRAQRLTEREPGVARWWDGLVNSLSLQSEMPCDGMDALESVRRLRRAAERVLELDPDPHRRVALAARTWRREALVLEGLGRPEESLAALERGWRRLGGVSAMQEPDRLRVGLELCVSLANSRARVGDEARAMRAREHATTLARRLANSERRPDEQRAYCIRELLGLQPPDLDAAAEIAAQIRTPPSQAEPQVARVLAFFFQQSGDMVSAKRWARRALAGWPEGHVGRELLDGILKR